LSLILGIACGLLTATGFGTADFLKLSTGKVGFLRTALFMQAVGSFFAAGTLKIVYDLLIYRSFRSQAA